MPDGILSLGVVFDKSGLEGGFADSAAIVKAGMDSLAVATESSSKKLRGYAVDLDAVARSAGQLTQKQLENAAATVKQIEGLELERKARALVRAGLISEKQGLEQLAAAQAITAQGSEGLAGSMEHVAGAAGHTVPQVAAASSAIRVLEGNMPIRAVERFAVTTLGLGPILQAAFPVFGAIALGEMVIRTGAEMIKFAGEAQDLANELGTGWLDGAVLQLEGFDKKLKEIEKNRAESMANIDRSTSEQKERAFKNLGEQQGPAAENNARMVAMMQERQGLESMIPLAKEKLALLEKINAAYQKAATTTTYGRPVSEEDTAKAKSFNIDLNSATMGKQIDEARTKVREYEQSVEAMQGKISDLVSAVGKGDAPKHGPETSKAIEEQMRSDEEAYNKLRMSHQLTLKEEGEFWAERLSKYAANTSQYASITGRLAEIYDKGASEAHKQFDALRKQISAPVPAGGNASQMFEHKDTEAEADERINRALEEQKKAAADIYGFTVRQIDLKEKLGQLTASQAAQQKLAASQAEQSAIVGPLQAQQKSMAPLGPIMLDDKQLAEYRRLQDQITAAMDQGAKQREQIVEQEALREQQQYQKLFNAINGPLNTFVDHWLTSGLRMGAALQKMYDSMAMSAINALLKIGEKWAAHELLLTAAHMAGLATRAGADANYAALSDSKLLAELGKWIAMEWAKVTHHVAANTAKTTSDIAAASASTAGAASAAAAKAAINAGVAMSSTGAGAAAAGAAVAAASGPAAPVAGPAAAAAYVAAMAPFVAMSMLFDSGGIMGHGRMGVNLSGADERVLSPSQTANFERMVNQSTSNNNQSEVHFHDHSNWNGVDGASVEGMYRKHAATGRREMMRQLRLANAI